MTRRLQGALALLIALAVPAPVQAAASNARELTLWLTPAEGALRGEMRLALPASGRFRLNPAFEITAVHRQDQSLRLTREAPGRYRVDAAAGAVTIRWQGRLASKAATMDAATIGHGGYLTAEGGLLPAQGGWYPRAAEPPAGPLTLTLHTPPGQRAVGSGSLVEVREHDEGITARYAHPRTRSVEVASGPWQARERRVGDIRLRTLFPARLDAAFADTYLEHAADYLVRFQARLGPYPFGSFTIAASPSPIGVAFPGFTLLGEQVIPLPFIPATSLGHELMHAWWGGAVGVDYVRGNWAEALTTYLADHAQAEARGEAKANRRRWLTDLSVLPEDAERTLVDFHGEADPAARLIGYQHGAMVFHMLQERLGEATFRDGLRRFAEAQRFRTADWQDLQAAFEAAAGAPLDAFFAGWVTRPGRPTLQLGEVRLIPTADGVRMQGELRQTGASAPWPLSVPLEVVSDAGRETFQVESHALSTPFSRLLPSQPSSLHVDPDYRVLRRLNATPTILRGLTLDRRTRLLVLGDTPTALGRRVLGREAEAVDPAAPVEGPLLVIGPTAAVAEWRAATGLPAPPRPMARAGQARMWTLPGTRVALVSGDTPEALARLVGRLRHQGGHSYVVQTPDGATGEAGSWSAAPDSPRVSFPP